MSGFLPVPIPHVFMGYTGKNLYYIPSSLLLESVDGWIILRWVSRRWDVGIWTGLVWPRLETGGGRL